MDGCRLVGGLAMSLGVLCAGCGTSVTTAGAKSEATMRDMTRSNFEPPPAVTGWPGLAVFDYDNDDDIDVFVTNGTAISHMFYRNDGAGHFEYFGNRAGVAFEEDSAICTGVGDFDNDGWLDLIIGRQAPFFGQGGPNNTLQFLKNMGPDEEGVVRFEDVTPRTRLSGITNAAGIGVGDIDNDGLLDLYIGRYEISDLDFAFISYLPNTPNVLLRNVGVDEEGVPVFEDITTSAGVAGTVMRGLAPGTAQIEYHVPTWAVYFSDVNSDGFQDIFSLQEIPGGVDLFINNGDLTFRSVQAELLNRHGGWMGITSADFNGDGRLDYFLANIGADANMVNTPYHIADAWRLERGYPYHRLLTQVGDDAGGADEVVVDLAREVAVARGPLPPVNRLGAGGLAGYEFGFGCVFFDKGNDGWADLAWTGEIILSGFVPDGPLRQDFNGVGRYLENQGDGSFRDLTAVAGMFNQADTAPLAFGHSRPGRAMAAIDLNGDGFEDVLRTNAFFDIELADSFQCLFNPGVGEGHWITVRLRGSASNRFGIGARVEASAGERVFVGEVVTTTSAFTAVHPQVHFGLGGVTTLDTLTVRWPSGAVSELQSVAVDRIVTIEE